MSVRGRARLMAIGGAALTGGAMLSAALVDWRYLLAPSEDDGHVKAACAPIMLHGNGFWRAMVELSESAAEADRLPPKRVASAVRQLHPRVQFHYLKLVAAVDASKVVFRKADQTVVAEYMTHVETARDQAWLYKTTAPESWSSGLKRYAAGVADAGRRNAAQDFTKELDAVCRVRK